MTAPVASGWSDSCRVGLAPTEERRLSTAHILDKHEGAILLGPGEWIVIVLALVVIADGVVIVLRSQASSVAE